MSLGAILLLGLGAYFATLLARRMLRFRLPALWALPAPFLAGIPALARPALLWYGYDTATPAPVHLGTALLQSLLFQPFFVYAASFLCLVFVDGTYRHLCPCRMPLAAWVSLRIPFPRRARAWAEALLVGAVFSCVLTALPEWAGRMFSGMEDAGTLDPGDLAPFSKIHGGIVSRLPALETLPEAVAALLGCGMALILGLLLVRLLRSPRRTFVILTGGSFLVAAFSAESGGEFAGGFLGILLAMGMFFGVARMAVRRYLRHTLPAYALAALLTPFLVNGIRLLQAANGWEQANGVLLLAMWALAPLLSAVLFWRRPEPA